MAIRPPDPLLTDGIVSLRPWGEPGDAREYIARTQQGWTEGATSTFAIVEGGAPVGSIAVRWARPDDGVAELGYWLAPQARGRGLCTRALRVVSRWAIADRGIARLQLRADERNSPSRRVAENAGFSQEGILRSSHFNPRLGRRVDFVMYSLLPGELR